MKKKYIILLGISLLSTQAYAQMPSDNIPTGLETPSSNRGLNNANHPAPSNHNNATYQSNMGNQYQYDLNNPSDRLEYSVDVDAQTRDKANPTIQLDRKMGQFGGGIDPDN
ncbi:hypothetical protein [Commensalibacter nepenthis]|uniref:Uncharacterized protein n=1 Tax=Commensalibacter nepenthis TaxID=3043872 RepID=A0ABT6Q5H4_9PROT|nr:hypothetical protein [Commensalibacter sp. TBRC 10068]MDI2112153.1 hypothetical protein [Commensalibacter sp. TBRC 10068]